MKTMTANGVYAMSAVTALTAQNTTGVSDIMNATPEFLAHQLDSVFTDIFPDAVKIGMVSSKELVAVIAEKLREYKAKNIVVDPVMVATSRRTSYKRGRNRQFKAAAFSACRHLDTQHPRGRRTDRTGNHLSRGYDYSCKAISEQYDCAVLCKGGHHMNDANDLLYKNGGYKWFNGRRINNPNTHGTGCTLSSAIASNLAKGFDTETAVGRAKEYISGALEAMLDLGKRKRPPLSRF